MKPANYGPFYAAGLYPKLAEVFRTHGYALAVHGSLANDFDLIAVPWVDTASDPQVVADECNATFAAKFSKTDRDSRPHGRIAYKLSLSFGDCSLDVSFTPRAGMETRALCPHGMPLEENVCGPCSEGRANSQWLIRKRGYYYRPNRAGYTASIAEAGRYTEAEAKAEAAIEPAIMQAIPLSQALANDDICPTTGQPHRMPTGQVCLYCHIGNLAQNR